MKDKERAWGTLAWGGVDEGRGAGRKVEGRAGAACAVARTEEQVRLGSWRVQGRGGAELHCSRAILAVGESRPEGTRQVGTCEFRPLVPSLRHVVHFARRALPDQWGAQGPCGGGPKASGSQRAAPGGGMAGRRGWGDWRAPRAESGPNPRGRPGSACAARVGRQCDRSGHTHRVEA